MTLNDYQKIVQNNEKNDIIEASLNISKYSNLLSGCVKDIFDKNYTKETASDIEVGVGEIIHNSIIIASELNMLLEKIMKDSLRRNIN